jgi:hypothetical protein
MVKLMLLTSQNQKPHYHYNGWKSVQKLKLTTNMKVHLQDTSDGKSSQTLFSLCEPKLPVNLSSSLIKPPNTVYSIERSKKKTAFNEAVQYGT